VTDEEWDERFCRNTDSIAFARLDDHQVSPFEPLEERGVVKRGDMVFKAVQRDMGLAVVLHGEIGENFPRAFSKDHLNPNKF
jgi:hypothetical protein